MERTALFDNSPIPGVQTDASPAAGWLDRMGEQLSSFKLGSIAGTQRRIMVYGVGQDAANVKRTIDKSGNRGLCVVGYYAPHAGVEVSADIPRDQVLCSSMALPQIAAKHGITEIVIAVRERRGGALPLTDLLNLKLQGIKVLDLSAFFEQFIGRVQIDNLRESWFIFGHGFRQGLVRMAVKRSFDVLASLTLFILALPVMLLAAIAIKLDSPGPVIYRQERVGLGGRTLCAEVPQHAHRRRERR